MFSGACKKNKSQPDPTPEAEKCLSILSSDITPVVVKYFGKQSKNLVAKTTDLKESISYAYTMDTKENVQKVYLSNTNSDYNYSESFTYNCKS